MAEAAESGTMGLAEAQARIAEARELLARLRGLLPQGLSLQEARVRWNSPAAANDRPNPAEAAARLAFFAYFHFMDRHFRPKHKWVVTPNPEARPDDEDQAPRTR